ncbi:MAG: glycosyltransferase [Pseudomonadota bacterium]
MLLAVATQNPATVAETYVRQHMRDILPGQTVGVALGGHGEGIPADMPFFARESASASWPKRRVAALATLARTGYAAALSRREEAALEAFFVKHRVTALLAEFGTTGLVLRKLAKRLGLRFVVNFHGYDATVLPKRNDIRHGYALLARDADAVVCGSRHFAAILRSLGFPAPRIHVIPCGVNSESFCVGDRDGRLIVGVGRLTAKKRPDLLVRAFAKARSELPDLRLEIVGDGPERTLCKQTVRDCGVASFVTLRGAQPHSEVRDALSRASIFAQHSMTAENGDQESQGISLIEAMSAALPVVVTDHNGFSETVVNGQTGFLSPEGDVDEMATNIVTLATDQGLRERMGNAGRQRVADHFDAEHTAAQLRDLLFPAPVQMTQVT